MVEMNEISGIFFSKQERQRRTNAKPEVKHNRNVPSEAGQVTEKGKDYNNNKQKNKLNYPCYHGLPCAL